MLERCVPFLFFCLLVAAGSLWAPAPFSARAQSVAVPFVDEKSAPPPPVIDPGSGFQVPPADPDSAPRPGVNWDPPPDPDPNKAFRRVRSGHERTISQEVRAACRLDSFRVEIDQTTFVNRPGAQGNLAAYAAAVPVSMADICKDARSRMYVERLFSLLRIVNNPAHNRPYLTPDGYTITLSYNFASLSPLESRRLTPELVMAINLLVRQYVAANRLPQDIPADEDSDR